MLYKLSDTIVKLNWKSWLLRCLRFWMFLWSIRQSIIYCVSLRQKLCLEKFLAIILNSAKQALSVLIRYLRFNILFVWLKNNTSAYLGSLKNNLQKVVKEQFCLCIAYMTISTLVWFMSILLVLSLNITNWSVLKNEISDLSIWIFSIDIAACWEAVKIILLMCIKLFYFTLNAALMFNLSPLVIWCLVILSKIYFVIGRQTDFVWRQDCLPPLIRK